MQLAKSITPKKIKTLHCFFLTILILIFNAFQPVFSQDNSPYSRYGLGDLTPTANLVNRGMGGISAGFTDLVSINFNNPASYSSFQSVVETKSKKIISGRAILDIGLDFENRSLIQSSPAGKFVANNALFSYVQIGVPLKKNMGLSFGLRPISRISYKIFREQRLVDPITGLPIDSAETRYEGQGGTYLASIGTGFSIFSKDRGNGMEEKLSIGINAGYIFGEKDYVTKRVFKNDTVGYYPSNYETKTNFNNLHFSVGIQYKVPLNKKVSLTLGAFGSWGQKLNATQDVLRETFRYDTNLGEVALDSVTKKLNVKGKIQLPVSFTVGFLTQKMAVAGKESGWILGMDVSLHNWSKYRFYGQADSVRNTWEVKMGGQFNPIPKRNYFSNVAYRFGLFFGPDYIKVGNKLSHFGGTFGVGLPLAINRQAPNQFTLINFAFEYNKRGNKDNLLRENKFTFALGFSLSDLWFGKRKYE